MDPFKGVEIFRAGDHVDSAGRPHSFGEKDLDRIAAYDPTRHEAPLVIGHPESNAPAFGWVERVYRDGPVLKADFKDVAPEFADLVKAGRFKKRSISLYPGGDLRHVGFLGAVPPALKGLKDVAFAEGEASTFEFGETEDVEKSLFTRFAEAFLGLIAPGHNDQPAGMTQAAKEEPMPGNNDTASIAALTAKMAEFSEALAAKDKQIVDLEAANRALANRVDATVATGRRAEIAQFCEGLAGTGQLTSYQAALAVGLMGALDSAGQLDFADDKTVQKPASELFKAFLESLPVQVEFGEIATFGRAAGKPGELDAGTLAVKIRDKVDAATAAGRVMSFAEAQAEVLRENQEGAR